jgi:hypothetical protein
LPAPAAAANDSRGDADAPRSGNGYVPLSGDGPAAPPGPRQQAVRRVWLHPFSESLPAEFASLSAADVSARYFEPFFRGRRVPIRRDERFQIDHIDFKVGSCHPFSGVTGDDTVFRLGEPVSSLAVVERLHLLPVRATLPDPARPPSPEDTFRSYVRPLFAAARNNGGIHVIQGDLFVSNGVQFKVVACDPPNGYVDDSTEIFTDGAPLEDIRRVHLLPIYETLPNCDKEITPDNAFFKYLEPFFVGRMVHVSQGDEIEIDGATFKVVAAEPPSGLVTLRSTIFSQGAPLRMEAVRRAQVEDDERLARQLQQEEDERARRENPLAYNFRNGVVVTTVGGRGGGGPIGYEEYRRRLAIILEVGAGRLLVSFPLFVHLCYACTFSTPPALPLFHCLPPFPVSPPAAHAAQ